MVFENATILRDNLTKSISTTFKSLLALYPLEEYVKAFDEYDSLAHYTFVSAKVSDICSKIESRFGKEALDFYHKLLLSTLIIKIENDSNFLKLPHEVQELFIINFKRIIHKIEIHKEYTGKFSNKDDKFNKDLSLCRLQTIPLGANKVAPGSLSKGILFKSGVCQFFKGIKVILKFGGIKPIYHFHMDSRDRDLLKEFNPEGWKKFYFRLAKLLEVNKNIKGVSGSAWFFDPVISKISPELSYLREIALNCGAEIFFAGATEGTIKNAIFMSSKRKKLYEMGKYHPVNYIILIPRKKLIKWANNHI